MSAHVEHKFKRGFILDEVRLRKLADVILARLDPARTGDKLQYVVSRGDAFSYETATIDDVLKEDNADWRKITKLELKSKADQTLELSLSFASAGTTLRIEGDDRDRVFVLYSDLRDYLGEEVNRAVVVPQRTIQLCALVFMFAFLFGSMWLTYAPGRSPTEIDADRVKAVQALKSKDLTEKLNYMIKPATEMRRKERPWWIALVGMAGFLILTIANVLDVPESIVSTLFPGNLFLFGAQKDRYDKRRHLLGNIFWVVLVGGLVSIVTGYFLWRLTLNK